MRCSSSTCGRILNILKEPNILCLLCSFDGCSIVDVKINLNWIYVDEVFVRKLKGMKPGIFFMAPFNPKLFILFMRFCVSYSFSQNSMIEGGRRHSWMYWILLFVIFRMNELKERLEKVQDENRQLDMDLEEHHG